MRMRARTIAATAVLITTIPAIAACGDSSSSDTASGTAGTTKTTNNPRVAMVIGLTSNAFMKTVGDGAKDGVAAVPGAKLTFTGPPAPDPTTETKMFRDILATKPAGVAVMPLQASLWTRTLKDASGTGIPLVAFNEAPAQPSPVQTFVGINDREAADGLLEKLQQKIGADAKGAIVLGNCIPGVATLDFRIKAYKEGIARLFPNASVKGPIQTGTEPRANFDAWTKAMAANRDALAFIGNCDSDGPGLVKAKQEMKVKGELLTFDIDLEALRGIKAGTMLAALGEAPYVRGYISMRLLADAAKTGKPLPKGFVNIKGEIITSENVDATLAREASPAAMAAAYKPYLDKFFQDPAAQIEPLTNVYK
jgi:ribose transport system substrate-binding protein